jgi:phosphatidate cytidylyltransferase
MAFNVKTFQTRTLTAIVFVAVMLLGLFINQWTFFILFTIIHYFCWKEYQKLIGLINSSYQQINSFHKTGIILLGWCFMMFMAKGWTYKIGSAQLHGIGWMFMLIIAIILLANEIVFKKQIQLKQIGYSLLGLVYVSLPLGLMINLRSEGMVFKGGFLFADFGYIFPAAIIFSIWINDTMAYIIGSLIGKTPLSKISPKKTWEGTIGGIILSAVVIALLSYFIFKKLNIIFIIIPLISSIIGTFGDLFESKLKRMANVKDSGSLLPGHGGFLDRFDSMLFAIPFVWLFVTLLNNFFS